ncbi:MAG TPA: hypothetical protein VII13_11110 [Vicinamibacteria bacterium]|jgi:hypothetical protein
MPRVADYSILADSWWTEGHSPDPISFNVPNNVDPDSRSILSFVLHVWSADDMSLKIRLNGVEVWNWNFSDGERLRFYQEVVPKGLVRAGTNNLSIDSSSGDYRMVKVSDVVIWWQANI